MWYVVLIPFKEASVITMVIFVDSQSNAGDIKSEYWSKRFSRSSSLAVLCTGSVLSAWLSFVEVMVSSNSLIAAFGDLRAPDGVFDFLCKVYFLSIFPREHIIVLTLNEM